MKQKIILLIVAIISSCHNNNPIKIDKNKTYAYQTEEFSRWEHSKKIKLNEAHKILYEYLKTHHESFKNTDKQTGYPLSYAYDNYYVFSSVTNIHKLGKFNLSGLWVNANTGEIKVVKIEPEKNFDTEGHIWTFYTGNDQY